MPRTSAKCPQKGPKRGLYKSKPVQARVIADHLAGHSNRSIARERGMDRKTVGRIVTQREVVERIAQYRQQLLSLVPKAIDVYDEALLSNDERIRVAVATKLVEGLQVMPRRNGQIGDMADRLAPPAEDRYHLLLGEMMKMILEKSDMFGLPLPGPVALLKEMAEAKIAGQSKKGSEENDPAISGNPAEKKPARQEVAYRPGQKDATIHPYEDVAPRRRS